MFPSPQIGNVGLLGPMTERASACSPARLDAGRDHRDRPRQQAGRGDSAMLEAAAAEADFRVRILPASRRSTAPRAVARRRARPRPHGEQHRQAALRPREDHARWLDPGLLGAAALARLLQRRAERHLGDGAGAVRDRLRDLPPRRAHAAHSHQRRRGEPGRDRRHRARAREAPRADHRHTLQHCQMADAAQFRRMAALGLCANLFANHLCYWGDAHYAMTMGPDRAERMDACATALAHGVPLAIHSDAPVTPLGPLFTAWCAVNRLTPTGRVLGERERISALAGAARDHARRRLHAEARPRDRLDRVRQVRRLLRPRRRSARRGRRRR